MTNNHDFNRRARRATTLIIIIATAVLIGFALIAAGATWLVLTLFS